MSIIQINHGCTQMDTDDDRTIRVYPCRSVVDKEACPPPVDE